MKNKLRIYMLVASLFMCCGVIGFGIYAATLGVTIPGALGYDGASNVITVTMAVENVGEYNGNTLIGKITKTFSESYVSASPTLQLGSSISDLYFYGSGATMVFKVTVGNISTSKRLITLNAPTGYSTNYVELSTAPNFITFPLQTYMNPGESKTFMFGLTHKRTGKYQLTAGSMSITTSVDTTTASTLFQYEKNFGWYATMGTNPYSDYNEPLRWMPIAMYEGIAKTGDKSTTTGEDGIGTLYSDYSQVTYKGLTDCPKIGESYYLLSEYVLDTKKVLTTDECGVTFDFYKYESGTYTKYYYDGNETLELTDIHPHDYSTSNIRAYLTGSRTAYRTYSLTDECERDENSLLSQSFEEQFNVQDCALYNNIVERSQNNLYVDEDEAYVEKTLLGKNTNTLDRFWLLSYTEFNDYCFGDDNIVGCERLCGGGYAYGYWWLRSPDWSANNVGTCASAEFEANESVCYAYGVRPAIQVACKV